MEMDPAGGAGRPRGPPATSPVIGAGTAPPLSQALRGGASASPGRVCTASAGPTPPIGRNPALVVARRRQRRWPAVIDTEHARPRSPLPPSV